MLDWKVLESEEALPPGEVVEEAHVNPRRWLLWLLGVLLLLIVVVAGGLWWRVQEQERLIRAQLTEFIEAEARVIAMGDPMQMRAFLDPQAPAEWRTRYEMLYGWQRPYAGLPILETMRLESEGMFALVVVSWPPPPGGEVGGREEPRAYRLVAGEWRRTAYPVEKVEPKERRTKYFLLRGRPEDIELLSELDLNGFSDHILEYWPAEWQARREYSYSITIEPQEFPFSQGWLTDAGYRFTTPEFSWFDMTSPLSGYTQYRLRLVGDVLYRLIDHQPYPPSTLPTREAIISAEQYRLLFYVLLRAEAEQWVLDEAQRRLLRNQWREEMNGTWRSPFERGFIAPDGASAEEVENAQAGRQASLYFLIDYLIATEGRAIPGQLAQQMAATSLETFDLATAVRAVTDKPLEELEAEAREFALTEENHPIE